MVDATLQDAPPLITVRHPRTQPGCILPRRSPRSPCSAAATAPRRRAPVRPTSRASANSARERDAGERTRGEPVGGGRRGGQQPEQQQRPHRLGRLGGDHPEQRQEPDPEQARRHAPGGRDLRRDRSEQQRASDRRRHQRRRAIATRRPGALRLRRGRRSTRTGCAQPAIPAPPPELVLKSVKKNTPKPEDEREDDADRCVVGRRRGRRSARAARRARLARAAPIPAPTATVAANRPTRWSTPAAAAASAPGNATWLSASPANTWPRSTTNQPLTPHASATNVPASSALRMNSWREHQAITPSGP